MNSMLQSLLWFNFLYAPHSTLLRDMTILKSSDNWTHLTLPLCSKYRCLLNLQEADQIWNHYHSKIHWMYHGSGPCLWPASMTSTAALNRNRTIYTLRKNAWEYLMGRIQHSEHIAKCLCCSPLHPFPPFLPSFSHCLSHPLIPLH